MKSVSDQFKQLRSRHECALIPFLTAGDPNLDATAEALIALDQNGADLIELGVPYSDPLADGPVIQAAATRALQQGVKLESVLEVVKSTAPKLSAPIILFTYYNPILNRGIEPFLKLVYESGVRGLVVPDLPLEEMQSLLEPAKAQGVEVTLLVAPTTPKERLVAIATQSQGFIYLVSVTGVTGVRTTMQARVETLLNDLKAVTDKPIGVGFGVSGPEQAQQLKQWGADGVIVGSAFVKRLADPSEPQGIASISTFCHDLKAALH
jgi:tryptophan synthase alpha chain